MAFVPHISVINKHSTITDVEIQKACAAIQKQVSNDLKSWWGFDAVVVAYPKSEVGVPDGSWRVYFQDKIDIDLAGYHSVDYKKVPVAYLENRDIFITIQDDWTVILSHEIVEMVVNPFVDKFIKGNIDYQNITESVEYIMEISDPCQSDVYKIDDVWVSDFVTPSYYTDVITQAGKKYSFTGAITAPLSLNNGGYFSFKRLNQWYQAVKDNFFTTIKKLGDSEPLNSNQQIEFAYLVVGGLAVLAVTIFAVKRIKSKSA